VNSLARSHSLIDAGWMIGGELVVASSSPGNAGHYAQSASDLGRRLTSGSSAQDPGRSQIASIRLRLAPRTPFGPQMRRKMCGLLRGFTGFCRQ
jgi:hypothetical protein